MNSSRMFYKREILCEVRFIFSGGSTVCLQRQLIEKNFIKKLKKVDNY